MNKTYAGIDIGTYNVKVVIAEISPSGSEAMQIIGTGTAVSKGMRHGYIINTKDAARGILEAVRNAEAASKRKIKSARVAIGGIGLDEMKSTGEISLTQSGGVVGEQDLTRVLEDSERRISSQLTNRKVIHALPMAYKIDNKEVYGRPVGMRGSKFSVDTLLITALEQHLNDLIESVEEIGIEVEDIMASPLAASMVTLTKAQKMAGVVLANIGAETLSIAVFENDTPISLKVLPTGAGDITNDIALSLKISLTEAEQMKRGAITRTDVPRKKVDEVVAARLREIFGLIDAHLKSIGRNRLLPAGIVITGGGSGIATVRDLAKAALQLPSQIGSLPGPSRAMAADATWAVAFGLCRWGYTTDAHAGSESFEDMFMKLGRSIVKGIRSLLP